MTDEVKKTQIKPDLARYTKGTSGSMNCGDQTAVELDGLALEEVYSVAASKLGVSIDELKAKYGHLNAGLQRMSLGGRIRGIATKAATAARKAEEKAAKAAAREAAKAQAEAA